MNDILSQRIKKFREILVNQPDGFVAGDIPKGKQINFEDTMEKWEPYFSFLREADGGRFGIIDIWSYEEYPEKQYCVVGLPGEIDRWLVIGQLTYDILALEANTRNIYLFDNDSENEPTGKLLGEFDEFFTNVVFGDGYSSVISNPDQDAWWKVLKTA